MEKYIWEYLLYSSSIAILVNGVFREKGNILYYYDKFLRKITKRVRWLYKPLIDCIYCFGWWVGFIIFWIMPNKIVESIGFGCATVIIAITLIKIYNLFDTSIDHYERTGNKQD